MGIQGRKVQKAFTRADRAAVVNEIGACASNLKENISPNIDFEITSTLTFRTARKRRLVIGQSHRPSLHYQWAVSIMIPARQGLCDIDI